MIEDEIRTALAAKAAALVERSADALGQLIDPGFVYLNAAGAVFDKAGYIDTYCISGRVAFQEQVIEALQVRAFDGFAVATMIVDDRFAVNGQPVARRYRSLAVFKRIADGWLWAAGQTAAVERSEPA